MGRVNAIAFQPGNPKVVYVGGADGGLWRSTTGGGAWTPLTDTMPTLSVADIAIDPLDPKHIFVATGDGFGYGNPFWGGTYSIGVWVTTDGGATWGPTGLTIAVGLNRTIRRLVMHPKNPKILLAATSAGLMRTADGGTTWSTLWATSTFDAEFDLSNPNIAYATTTQVLKSTNAGATFAPLTATCAGARYNIEVAASNPKVLYTLCTNGTVQKSTDMGSTWTTTTAPGVTLYGYYDNVLAVSPVDANVVLVAGFDIKKSTNGGSTWAAVPPAGHVDNHCLRFVPGSSTSILSGNDGGVFGTTNGGSTWVSLNKGLSITQYYRLGLSRITAGLLTAGAQDNGNMKLSAGAWTSITNADGMGGFIDFTNDMTVYATIQYRLALSFADRRQLVDGHQHARIRRLGHAVPAGPGLAEDDLRRHQQGLQERRSGYDVGSDLRRPRGRCAVHHRQGQREPEGDSGGQRQQAVPHDERRRDVDRYHRHASGRHELPDRRGDERYQSAAHLGDVLRLQRRPESLQVQGWRRDLGQHLGRSAQHPRPIASSTNGAGRMRSTLAPMPACTT